MAPLPDNNTARLLVRYSAGGADHTLKIRAIAAVPIADVVTTARGFISELLSTLGTNVEFYGADYAAAGENFSTPVVWGTPLVGTNNLFNVTGILVPNFVSFVGRDGAGRRFRMSVFGYASLQENDYRLELGDDNSLDAALDIIEAVPTVFLTVAGFKPVMKQYFNIGRNAYWQRKQRRTGSGT